ncbi:hypothetical protein MKW98_000462, partial [Papaver atlanticum]
LSPLADDIVDILPKFHNLDKLLLKLGEPSDKSLFLLLKSAPNLTRLVWTIPFTTMKKKKIVGLVIYQQQAVCFNTSSQFALCILMGMQGR